MSNGSFLGANGLGLNENPPDNWFVHQKIAFLCLSVVACPSQFCAVCPIEQFLKAMKMTLGGEIATTIHLWSLIHVTDAIIISCFQRHTDRGTGGTYPQDLQLC